MTNNLDIRTAAKALLDAFGGDTPDWLRAEALALATALDAPEPRVRVVIALEGGMVQGCVTDRRGVDVTVVDYDTEGADGADLISVPQDGGGTAEAVVGGPGSLCDAAWIDGLDAAIEAHDTPPAVICQHCAEVLEANPCGNCNGFNEVTA